ncbi:MAG: nitronate monooxygenase [Deltaproteobacteria bacterium]|jgi:nitronate monooxygenase|nr:nitronate monooxygenase [Deltaproteobacteria bacterium]
MTPIAESFVKDLGIEVPVICGPMFPGSNPELIAAVSEAGGIGVIQPVTMTFMYKYELRDGIRKIRELTSKPIGMNFTLMQGVKVYEKRTREWMDIAIEEGIKFFVTSLGDPTSVVREAEKHGIRVVHDVTNRAFAQRAVDAGVYGLNCVNNRAGGQTGRISPEQMFEELHGFGLPLICAGGVGDAQDFRRALDLGYAAAQVGTRFLATPECRVNQDYKQCIVGSSESDIVITNKLAGTDSSVIRTPDIEKLGLRAGPIASRMLRGRKTKKLMRMIYLLRTSLRYRQLADAGSGQYWQAGRGVGAIDDIMPAGEVVKRFAASL